MPRQPPPPPPPNPPGPARNSPRPFSLPTAKTHAPAQARERRLGRTPRAQTHTHLLACTHVQAMVVEQFDAGVVLMQQVRPRRLPVGAGPVTATQGAPACMWGRAGRVLQGRAGCKLLSIERGSVAIEAR